MSTGVGMLQNVQNSFWCSLLQCLKLSLTRHFWPPPFCVKLQLLITCPCDLTPTQHSELHGTTCDPLTQSCLLSKQWLIRCECSLGYSPSVSVYWHTDAGASAVSQNLVTRFTLTTCSSCHFYSTRFVYENGVRRMMGTHWADGNCSSHFLLLCWTAADQKLQDLSFQNVACPQHHRATFVTAMPQGWRYHYIPT